MDILISYRKAAAIVMGIFRWDLQLHFFWGCILTLLGVYWAPLYFTGIVVTLIKESLDLWSKGIWSWGDVIWGLIGCAVAYGYVQSF